MASSSSASSAYDEALSVAKGGLKFKRASSGTGASSTASGATKKKKIKHKTTVAAAKMLSEGKSSPSSTPRQAAKEVDLTKTDAERKFEEISRKRQQERIMKVASKSHKQNVEEFNEKLSKLSEHYDIPKVGPG